MLPESRAHFEALEIPAELLARVEELELCFDAGAEVFPAPRPAPRPGTARTTSSTSARSKTSPRLLPNLREVTVADDGVLAVPNAAKVFTPRGIDTD